MLKNTVTIMFFFFVLNSFTDIKYGKSNDRPKLMSKISSTLSFNSSATSDYFNEGQYVSAVLDYYDIMYNDVLLDYEKREIDYPKA